MGWARRLKCWINHDCRTTLPDADGRVWIVCKRCGHTSAPPREERRDMATERELLARYYAPDPQTWPSWTCSECSQKNVGWTTVCGRCLAVRVVVAPDRSRG